MLKTRTKQLLGFLPFDIGPQHKHTQPTRLQVKQTGSLCHLLRTKITNKLLNQPKYGLFMQVIVS
jgi:hypothetical protein